MAINPAINGTGNLTNMQILNAMAAVTQAGKEAEIIGAGGRLPAAGGTGVTGGTPVTATAPKTAEGAQGQEGEDGGKAKGKGKGKGKKGKPDHAGGPNKAKALPPGLQGKDLPAGNPWKAVADRLEKEKAEQQKKTATPGDQPPTSPAELLAKLQQLVNAANPQGAAPAPQAIGAMLTAVA